MKRALRTPVLFSFLWVLLFNSCERPAKQIFRYIPENVKFVVTLHPGNLIEKGKISELSFLEQEDFGAVFGSKIIANPELSGMDMDNFSSIFVFGEEPSYLGLIMPIKDKSEFENRIAELETEIDEKFERMELDDYDLIKQKAGIILYNNSIALALSGMGKWEENLQSVAKELIDLKDEERILSDKDFNKFLARQKDINAWVTSTNLEGLDRFGNAMDLLGGIKNNYGHVFLEFQKGAIDLTTNLRLNRSLQETVNKFNVMDKEAIKALLDYIPSEDLVFIGNSNVNPEKIIDLLKFINKDFNKVFEEMTNAFDLTEENVSDAFSGEMAFSINEVHRFKFEEDKKEEKPGRFFDPEENMPVIVSATRMRNASWLNRFLEVAEEEDALVRKEKYYVVKSRGFPVYISVNNRDLIISNKEDIIIRISEKGKIEDNVTRTEYSDILIQDPICFYLNLDAGSYSENIQDIIDHRMGEKVEIGLETFFSKLKSLSFSANLEEWKLRLELTEEDEYSLYTLLSQIDK